MVVAARQEATPDNPSEQVKLAVTLLLFQLAALGAGESVVVTAGGVLSILRLRELLAVFPALSVAVPEIVCFAPSVLTVVAAGQVATPDRLSEQVKDTVTLLLFQPAAFAAGLAVALIVGAVLSILTVSVALALFPALSVAVRFTT